MEKDKLIALLKNKISEAKKKEDHFWCNSSTEDGIFYSGMVKGLEEAVEIVENLK